MPQQQQQANQTPSKTVVELENKFWQAMVNEDVDTATSLLCEPALMVSSHGTLKFTREDYKRMAEQGPMVVKSYQFSDMDVVFPNEDTAILTYHVKQGIAPRGEADVTMQEMMDSSVWMRRGQQWQCVMHTETPVEAKKH